jgi:hypothetical protein
MVAPQPTNAARAGVAVAHWAPHVIAGVLAPALLTVGGLAAQFDWTVAGVSLWIPLVVVGVATAAVATTVLARRQVRTDALERNLHKALRDATFAERSLVVTVNATLKHMAERAGYYSAERVSLFRFEGDCFVLLGPRCDGRSR